MTDAYIVFEFSPIGVKFHGVYLDELKAYEKVRENLLFTVRKTTLIK